MASTLPPVKGAAFSFPISLVSQADTDIFKTTVTITTADVWVSKDGGAFVAVTAAPTELQTTPGAANTGVLWQGLTAAEMTADVVTILYHDAAGSEWQDAAVTIYTVAQTLDTISTRVLLGVPAAAPGAANGALIAGTNAATTITSAAGAALTLSSTGANGAGLVVSGNGSGAGVDINAGATGVGIDIDAAAGAGIDITASPVNWVGAIEINALTGKGVNIEAPASRGAVSLNGRLDITGPETAIQLCSTNGPVVNVDANGAGTGVRISTGTGGTGIELITDSTGIDITTVAGDGIAVSAGGAGRDIVADITGVLSGSVGSVASYGTLVADIWSYTTRTLTSLSALVSSVAAAVWAYATRTLTSTAASTTAAVSGSTLTITNATTYSATLTGLTIPADWLDMWLTIKDDDSRADSAAIIQIHKSNPSDLTNDGLVYLNGAAGTKADGSLTVDQAAGTVAIRIEATATDDLARQSAIGYDVKVQSTAAGLTLLTAGVCNVELTETRTID